ncbi:hypothetical protein SS05631_d64880 (plasmid) [Sinorhizobium sp. CCBAU 05631]|nr:hypothetical protein SS05631_d64880 [Sinorhizobium sp. CCBAU 05631]
MNEFTYSTSSQTSTVDPADPLGVRSKKGGWAAFSSSRH